MIEYTTPEEDEAFNEMERQAQQRKEAVKAQLENNIDAYAAGWNDALERAAFEIDYNFITAFGKDTLGGIAIYIRRMKK